MINKQLINKYKGFEFKVKEILNGFITGLHKSPFHGFSSEFLEFKQYSKGDNVKDIDWKLYGKTDKLFIKKYQEETNLKCHFIIDNSSSMYYPEIKNYFDENEINKFSFSIFATGCIMEIMKKQQDAIGMSLYTDKLDFFIAEKTSPKHHNLLFHKLEESLEQANNKKEKQTNTYKILHHISEKLTKKTLVILFTDMLDSENKDIFEALKHLKYNSHKVILFHIYDSDTEKKFNVDNKPSIFIDLETKERIKLKRGSEIKEIFEKKKEGMFNDLDMKCSKYNIDYVPVDIRNGFNKILEKYLQKRKVIK